MPRRQRGLALSERGRNPWLLASQDEATLTPPRTLFTLNLTKIYLPYLLRIVCVCPDPFGHINLGPTLCHSDSHWFRLEGLGYTIGLTNITRKIVSDRLSILRGRKNMNSQDRNDREQELQHREQELKDRELALRLRELEAEIHAKSQTKEIPIDPNPLSIPERKSLRYQFNQFLRWSKVIGGIIVGLTIAFVGLFVGIWLVYIALLGGVGFISYQLLFGKSNSQRP